MKSNKILNNLGAPSIDFLVTTVGKTKKEIISIIKNSNLLGNVIVGNQKANSNNVDFVSNATVNITIINMTSVGTSLNRNTIFGYSRSDYVTFWDDDSYLSDSGLTIITEFIKNNRDYDAIRFNTHSDNLSRPLKIISVNRNVTFKDVRSFGVCGIFFKRDSLLKNNVSFREDVGPGTSINHGEDSLFLHLFFEKNMTMFQNSQIPINISQSDSCWFDKASITDYYFSQGFIYGIMYPHSVFLHGLFHVFKSIKRFGWKYFFLAMISIKKGARASQL